MSDIVRSVNIFDDAAFFEGYKQIRENTFSANNVEEKPQLFSLLPDLSGKRILDLGCGYGENCKKFIEMGAAFVMGIDISEKMLEVAREKHAGSNIVFAQMGMEDLPQLEETFDLVVSSLAIHYVCDFDKLVHDVAQRLNDGGFFIFSQEHPITTAPLSGIKWYQKNDVIEGMLLTDYAKEGRRDVSWIIEHVIKYHRTTASIINSLIDGGFTICHMIESTVPEEIIRQEICLSRCRHVPDYLMVKAQLK